MKLEEKIDLMLKKLDFIEKRLDDIDSKYDYLSSRIDDLEEKVKSRNLKVDNLLSTKPDSETIQKLNEKISTIEKFKLAYDKTTVMQECQALEYPCARHKGRPPLGKKRRNCDYISKFFERRAKAR